MKKENEENKEEKLKEETLKVIGQLKTLKYQLTPNLSNILLEYEFKVMQEINKNQLVLIYR